MSQLPPDAIEAAHKAWREQASTEGSIFEYNLQAALEAAAPHLMAKAWEQGYLKGFVDYASKREPKRPNPYKPTP